MRDLPEQTVKPFRTWPWWDGEMTHNRMDIQGATVIMESKEEERLIVGLMGEMVKIKVLERKDKQAPGRECWLVLYTWMELQRKGETIKAADAKPGDVIRWNEEPLKVVSIEPWEKSKHEEENNKGKD